MKTIGIIGGMSAASTRIYYQMLCDMTRDRLDGLHSPDLLIRSLDFAPIAAAQATGDWPALGAQLKAEPLRLQAAGAGLLLLATSTMHRLAPQMMAGVSIPLLHIADVAQTDRSAEPSSSSNTCRVPRACRPGTSGPDHTRSGSGARDAASALDHPDQQMRRRMPRAVRARRRPGPTLT